MEHLQNLFVENVLADDFPATILFPDLQAS